MSANCSSEIVYKKEFAANYLLRSGRQTGKFREQTSMTTTRVFLKPAFEIGRDPIFGADAPKNLCGAVRAGWEKRRPLITMTRETENYEFRVKRRTSR